MKDLTWIIELLVTVIALVVTRYVIPWLKRKTEEANNAELDFWLDFAVRAAEEQYKAETKAGPLKFGYVEDFLRSKGFTYDAATIAVLIDGKVRELFNRDDYRGRDEE